MNHIFRVPVDNQHFKDTIENGKPLSEIINFLNNEDKAKLQRISKDGLVRYWGSIPGESNKRSFAKFSEGDDLLCYRSGKYIALAKIAFTAINPDLAKHSWGITELGTTWELIYFFSEVQLFSIDADIINKEFNFNITHVMGFGAIKDEKVKEFSQRHGSMETFIKNLGYETKIQDELSEQIKKLQINSPYEAQHYLIQLGNELNYETYVPANDAGRSPFGVKLGDLITVQKEDLEQYVAPALLKPMSNIDVIWFKDGYRPRFFYEVIHKTGWSEALLRLDLVNKHYENAKVKIIGSKENENELSHALNLWSGPRKNLDYKNYDQLLTVHSETLYANKLVDEFLE